MTTTPLRKKRFGLKVAIIVFGFVVTANVVLLVLDHLYPHNRHIIIPAWFIDAPGLPLAMFLGAPMGESEIGPWDYIVATSVGLFSAIFWGGVAGMIFRSEKKT